VIKAPYTRHRKYDIVFEQMIKNVRDAILNKDDDYVLLCAGTTGTGKSSLMLWGYELYAEELATVDNIGLTRESFANALKYASTLEGKGRFCANDEANISKREALTKYNRELIDLYFSIRGLKIFHWWNNPSIDMIDKPFIEERIKGLIYIATKDADVPRVYYFFRKRELLRIWEKYQSLKLPLLKKIARQYAYYKGWFRSIRNR
jgi:hypothetical protein